MEDALSLCQFKMKDMVANPAILTVAKRGSGKSFLIRDIVYNLSANGGSIKVGENEYFFKSGIPAGTVISVTDKLNSFYEQFFPSVYIHHEPEEKIFKKILFRQTEMLEKFKRRYKEGIKVDPRAILIMDDCLSKDNWKKMEAMNEILFNGRHYQLTYILAMQYSKGIGPALRGNFDYICLLNEDFYMNMRKLYEEFAGMFPSYQLFYQVFKECTEDYRCMIIDNRKPSRDIKKKIFWYKAVDLDKKLNKPFRFGRKDFREYHHEMYDPNHLRRNVAGQMDLMDLFSKSKKSVPRVKVIMGE
jgi:hypothetical protein